MAWPMILPSILAATTRAAEPPGAGLMGVLIVVALVAAFGMTVVVFVRNRRPERHPPSDEAEPPKLPDHPG